MVIAGDRVITGSFSFTKTAEESSAENCLVKWTTNWLRDARRIGRSMRGIRRVIREGENRREVGRRAHEKEE
jgi:hypothetical protein